MVPDYDWLLLETVVPQISLQLLMSEIGNGILNQLYWVALVILGTTAAFVIGK